MMAATMRAESQISLPPSFVALYVPEGRQRPSVPWETLLQRYEWCEDMAQSLVDTARMHMNRLGLAESDVAQSVAKTLGGPETGLSEAEAGWVACRLQELLTQP
jgi:hypothetical protein